MEQPVSVAVTSVTDRETLRFRGAGYLRRDDRGTHLRYTAETEGGESIHSAIHLGMGRAVIDGGEYRLLLDPHRPTRTEIAGGLTLRVKTHRVHAALTDGGGVIQLHYTLLAARQTLQTVCVTLELAAMEKEKHT